MKLFLILGNQLFAPKYLNDFKDHIFYMAEDYDLCTFEKHHKHKILLFLSSMRSYCDELRSKNFNLTYKDKVRQLYSDKPTIKKSDIHRVNLQKMILPLVDKEIAKQINLFIESELKKSR